MELSLDITTCKCDSLNLSFNNNHQGTPPKKPPRKDSAEYHEYYDDEKDKSQKDIIEERPSDMNIFDDIHRDLEEKGMLLSPTRVDCPEVHEVTAVPLKSDRPEDKTDKPSQFDTVTPNTNSSESSMGRPPTPDDMSERKLAIQKSISWLRQELVRTTSDLYLARQES